MATTTSAKARVSAIRAEPGDAAQRLGQRLRQRRAPVGAGEDADQRDADLHGREEARRVLGELAAPAPAPRLPALAIASSRARRAETIASSDIAKKPLSTTSTRTISIGQSIASPASLAGPGPSIGEVRGGRTPRRHRAAAARPAGQPPILPPPCRVIATTAGRTGSPRRSRASGSTGPRSRTAGRNPPSRRRRRRGAGPRRRRWRGRGSASGRRARRRPARGRRACEVPRASPSVSTAQSPSVRPVSDGQLPSVATQSRPALSMAQLSGMPNQPLALVAVEKVAPTSATDGSPHCSRISQVPLVAAKSPPSSAISMMWPKAFSGRGLAAFGALAPVVVGQHHVDPAGVGVAARSPPAGPSSSRRAGRRRGASRSARRPGSRSRSPRSAAPRRGPAAATRPCRRR